MFTHPRRNTPFSPVSDHIRYKALLGEYKKASKRSKKRNCTGFQFRSHIIQRYNKEEVQLGNKTEQGFFVCVPTPPLLEELAAQMEQQNWHPARSATARWDSDIRKLITRTSATKPGTKGAAHSELRLRNQAKYGPRPPQKPGVLSQQ